MAEITIIKGQEFMIAVKEEIAREALFLNNIVVRQTCWIRL